MILVDPRVGSSQFRDPISQRVNCEVLYANPQLSGGDFAFEGNGPNDKTLAIGIELKTIEDMLGSMRSDRMALQLAEMNGIYDICYVIIQGQYKPDDKGNLMTLRRGGWQLLDLAYGHSKASKCFRYAELDKYINGLEVRKNVIIVRSTCMIETVWQIVNRYNWWQKPWEEHSSTDPIKTQVDVMFTKPSLIRVIASNLPGIGWVRSKAVEQAFLNTHNMVNAPHEAWEAIEGIGEKTAHNVWKALRERKK